MRTHIKAYFIIPFVCITCCIHIHSQYIQGPPAASVGEQAVCLNGIAASVVNPAGLADQTDWQAMIFAYRPFLLEELQSFYGAASHSIPQVGSFGISMQQNGFDQYNELLLGFFYAKKLSSGVSLGIRLDYVETRIEDYGSSGAFTADIGMQWQLADDLRLGFATFNPFQIRHANDGQIPSTFDLGIEYALSDRVQLYSTVHKTLNLSEDYRIGVQYAPHDRLSFSLGVQTARRTIAGGFEIELFDGFLIHSSAAIHNTLGISPGMAFIYRQN